MTVRFSSTLLAVVVLLGLPGVTFGQRLDMPREGDRREPARDPAVKFEEKIGVQVPLDLRFRNSDGNWVTLGECVGGKPTILVLGYNRCPQLCNMVLNGLVDAMRDFPADFTAGKQFNIITVSIDPKEQPQEAAAKKNSYLEAYRDGQRRDEAAAGWHFLVGPQSAITPLARTVGFNFRYDNEYKEYKHESGIIVLTPDGITSRYFFGIGFRREYKTADGAMTTLYQSLLDAGARETGGLAEGESTSLLCDMRGLIESKYGPNILLAIRIGGIIAIVGLLAGLTYLIRREPRPQLTTAPDAGSRGPDRPTEVAT